MRALLAAAAVLTGALALVAPSPAAAQEDPFPPDLVLDGSPPDWLNLESTAGVHVNVTNTGGPASNGRVLVEAGAGLEITAAAVGWFQVPCTIAGSTATCVLGAVTGPRFVAITVRGVAEGPTAIEVTAVSDGADANPADNTLSAPIHVRGPSAVDLALTDTISASTVAPTERLTHTLTVANRFSFPASGVRLTSAVPDAFEVRSATLGWLRTCQIVGQNVTCNIGDLAANAQVSMAFVLEARDAPGTVQLSATVSATTPDPEPANNVRSRSVSISGLVEPPDLIASLDLPATSPSGATLQAWFSVVNQGDEAATGLVAEIDVPEGIGVVSATTGLYARPCTISATTVICTLSPSPHFWLVDLRFEPTDGTFEITASVRADQADADPSSNTVVDTIEVGGPAPADLWITSSVSPSQARPGDVVKQQLDVGSNSTGPAPGTVVTTTVPDEFEIRSAAIGWLSRPCTVVGQDVTCAVGNLPAGASRFVLLDLVVAAGTPSRTVDLSARVDGSLPDPGPSSNVATSHVDVDASGALPDLGVVATLAPMTVGSRATLDVYASNAGGLATDVSVTIQLPAGLRYVSSSTGWLGRACTAVGSTVTCSFSTVPNAWFASIRVEPETAGTYDVDVEVQAAEADADPSDDTVTVTASAA